MNEKTNKNNKINLDTADCEFCRFFQPTEDEFGECRYNAPVTLRRELDKGNNFVWPEVGFGDWCGRFKPKAKYAGGKENA